jgi:membrane-bound ClpP family serine protease
MIGGDINLDGEKIAGNVLAGIGIVFFLLSAFNNYSGSMGMTFLAIGFLFFMVGTILLISSSRKKPAKQKQKVEF